MRRSKTMNLVISGLLLAIGILVPSIFHGIGISGRIFLPMHIPVLLGGFLLPPMHAILLGILTPILNNLVTGMPPVFPMMVIMIFELAAYGLVASLTYRKFKLPILVSLISSMLVGRLVVGGVVYGLVVLFAQKMDPILFVQGGIVTGLPGIIIQIVVVPLLMLSINKYTTINWD